VSAEAVAIFRVLLGVALLAFFAAFPVDASWLARADGGEDLHGIQRLVVPTFLRYPALVNGLRWWLAVSSGLFIIGCWSRAAFGALTAGALAWSAVYTLHYGAHSVSALLLALVFLLPSRWGDAWSFDAARRRVPAEHWPYHGYTVWIPGLVIGVAFAAAGISKLGEGATWIANGTIRYHFLTDSVNAPVDWGTRLAASDTASVLLSVGAVVVELSVLPAVLFGPYPLRVAAGLASASLFAGFVLFQGIVWPSWWVLLLAFLPWHRMAASAGAHRTNTARLSPLQKAAVALLIVQQVAASVLQAEVPPLLSAYDMYSATYASPEAYEKSRTDFTLRARAQGGAVLDCDVDSQDIERLRAKAGEGALVLRRCFGDAAISSYAVEAIGPRVDWVSWRLVGERRETILGPVALQP
jgi:hypothetical protein